jgi:hypothetical protein
MLNQTEGLNIQNEVIDYNQIELLIIDLKRYIGYNVNYWNSKMNDFLKKSKYDDVNSPGFSPSVGKWLPTLILRLRFKYFMF